MAVDITSHDRDTNKHDPIDKPVGHTQAVIPVHHLIDHDTKAVTLYSEPGDGRYPQSSSHLWGATAELPPPVGTALDADKLKDYAD
jgi:hypothetical protein